MMSDRDGVPLASTERNTHPTPNNSLVFEAIRPWPLEKDQGPRVSVIKPGWPSSELGRQILKRNGRDKGLGPNLAKVDGQQVVILELKFLGHAQSVQAPLIVTRDDLGKTASLVRPCR